MEPTLSLVANLLPCLIYGSPPKRMVPGPPHPPRRPWLNRVLGWKLAWVEGWGLISVLKPNTASSVPLALGLWTSVSPTATQN